MENLIGSLFIWKFEALIVNIFIFEGLILKFLLIALIHILIIGIDLLLAILFEHRFFFSWALIINL